MNQAPRAAWSATSILPWFAAVGLAVAMLSPLAQAWHSDSNLGHGWLAPLLAAYLWWERWAERPTLRATPVRGIAWTLAIVTLGALLLPVRLLLVPYPLWPAALTLYVGAIAGIAALLAWLLAGRAGVRWLAAPLIVLPAALPWPTFVEVSLILPLREGMAALAAEISNLLDQPALAVGTSIRLGSGWVGVDDACGGIRSLQGCVLLALFFGEWLRFSIVRRAALVIAAAGAAVAGNFARVLYLAVRGTPESIERAHDLAGWLALAVSVAGTVWLALHWAGYRLPRITARPAVTATSAAAPAWRLAGAFAIALLAGELGARTWFASARYPGFDREGWTVQFPTALRSYQAETLSDLARDMLRPDYFAAGHWRSPRNEPLAAYYIEWHRGQIARFIPFVHNPTVCLPLSGCELQEELPEYILERGADRIPFRTFRFRRVGQDLLVAFTVWDPLERAPLQRDGERDTLTAWVASAWRDVAARKQHQPAQMFTLALPWSPTAETELTQLLSTMVLPRGGSDTTGQ